MKWLAKYIPINTRDKAIYRTIWADSEPEAMRQAKWFTRKGYKLESIKCNTQ